MVFASELPVCLFDFFFLRGTRDAKALVIIAEFYCHLFSVGKFGVGRVYSLFWGTKIGNSPVRHRIFPRASLLHTDLETFARTNHVGDEFARGIQYLFNMGIFVVWIMI